MESTLALSVDGLRKSFLGTQALGGVSLGVPRGQVHALLGENGSGKSTLIKVLSGYHRPDQGSVTIGGTDLHFGSSESSYAAGARFVHQDLGLAISCSVLDNLRLTVGFPTRFGTIVERTARAAAEKALQRVGLDIDTERLISDLTPTERTEVAIARAVQEDGQSEVRLLVLDEPTATLPDAEVARLHRIVRNVSAEGVGVLYVTHRLDEVFEIADFTTVLRDGRVEATTPVADLTRDELVRQLVGSEFEDIHRESMDVPPAHGPIVLQVDNMRGGSLRGLSLTARQGDVIGIAGITGSGREAFCSTVFGAVEREGGDVTIAGESIPPRDPQRSIDAGVALIPADRRRLGGFLELTARENVTLPDLRPFWRKGRLRRTLERREVARWYERLDVRPPGSYEQKLDAFSGGNQQKLLFGKWLRCEPKVILVDEPTQGVDVGAKATLHRELLEAAASGCVVIVSSSDTDELVALCHRILVLRSGRIAAELTGEQLTPIHVSRESVGQ